MGRCSQCNIEYSSGERFCPLDGGAVIDLRHAGDPMIGRRVADRYLIKELLGKGGMGEVYLADHVALDKEVALKFILEKYTEDPEVLTRFHREARTASRIGHENIIDITDVGETEDRRHFIVMEYLRGADLNKVLRASGPMEVERALHIIQQVLSGLAAAHEKGVVHRDMKPENVYLTERGGVADFIKIMDFGISKFIAAHDSKVRLTETGAVIGTPIYMAPEQAQAVDTIDQRADVYAVGVMLYEMLCGRPPFTAPSYLALVTQHLHEEPPPPRSLRPEIPPGIERAILGALAKRPEDRIASARDFSRALERANLDPGDGRVSDARFAPTLERPRTDLSGAAIASATLAPAEQSPTRRRLWPAVLVGLMALGAAAAAAFVLWPQKPQGASAAPASPSGAARGATGDSGAADAAPAPVIAPMETAVLEVDSSPRGARLYLDGELIGKTPLSLDSVEPGEYTLRLELEDFKTIEADKAIRAGYRESFYGTLAEAGSRKSGRVKKASSTKVGQRPRPRRKKKAGANEERPEPEPRAKSEPEPKARPEPKKPRPKTRPKPKPKTKPNPYLDD